MSVENKTIGFLPDNLVNDYFKKSLVNISAHR
jgi:hypothetical protein